MPVDITPAIGTLKWKIDCIIDIEYSGRTLRREQLVLGAWTPCEDLQGRVTLP